ncbi:hypothetical protein PHBOTO_004516 [Pseudozyma hubeiensis]|nr:hypothetical protein PHBOTO_004516 [Pseudozyma hubeiensis]
MVDKLFVQKKCTDAVSLRDAPAPKKSNDQAAVTCILLATAPRFEADPDARYRDGVERYNRDREYYPCSGNTLG